MLTRDNLWLFERLTRALGDEKMVGFCFRQDVTQHGHQDLDEAKICISFFFFCISLCIHFGSSRSSCELLPDFPIKGHLKRASSYARGLTLHCLPEWHNNVADFFKKLLSNISSWHAILVLHAACLRVQTGAILEYLIPATFSKSYAMNNRPVCTKQQKMQFA